MELGSVIDEKSRVVRLIAERAMGAVYEAQQVAIGRKAAVNVLHAEAGKQQELVSRFEREALAASCWTAITASLTRPRWTRGAVLAASFALAACDHAAGATGTVGGRGPGIGEPVKHAEPSRGDTVSPPGRESVAARSSEVSFPNVFYSESLSKLSEALAPQGALVFPVGKRRVRLSASDLQCVAIACRGRPSATETLLKEVFRQDIRVEDLAFLTRDIVRGDALEQIKNQDLVAPQPLVDSLSRGTYAFDAGEQAFSLEFAPSAALATIREPAKSIGACVNPSAPGGPAASPAAPSTDASTSSPPPKEALRQRLHAVVAGAFDQSGSLHDFFWLRATRSATYKSNGRTVEAELWDPGMQQILSVVSRGDLRQLLAAEVKTRFPSMSDSEPDKAVSTIMKKMGHVFTDRIGGALRRFAVDRVGQSISKLEAVRRSPEELTRVVQTLRSGGRVPELPEITPGESLGLLRAGPEALQDRIDGLRSWQRRIASGAYNQAMAVADAFRGGRNIGAGSYFDSLLNEITASFDRGADHPINIALQRPASALHDIPVPDTSLPYF